MRARSLASFWVAGALVLACSSTPSSDGGLDARDAPPAPSGANGKDAAAGDDDAGVPAPRSDANDITDPKNWSSHDATTLGTKQGFAGGVFDGRFVYFVPWGNGDSGAVTRYDTTKGFADAGAWSVFDTKTNIGNAAKGFIGGVFDGRYVYLVPHYSVDFSGLVVRYDTKAAFDQKPSWSSFDATKVNPNARGFRGGAFDGRYVYFVPRNDGAFDGWATRYDTTQPFGSGSSWATYDVSEVNGGAKGFVGGAFDKTHVYLSPASNAQTANGADGVVARVDGAEDFRAASSWKTFDIASVDPKAIGFNGAIFDGKGLTFVPSDVTPTPSGVAAQYNTFSPFAEKASWAIFDVAKVDPQAVGFRGGTFDGQYVYLSPYTTGTLARFDSAKPFTDASAWKTFDIASVAPGAKNFFGAVYDGRAVYFVPHKTSTVVRFEARSTARPSSFTPSFL